MPGVVVLNPGLVDGYGNLLSVTYDAKKNAIRLMTDSVVDGYVTVSQMTASNLNATVVQPVGTNLHTVVDGYVTVAQATGSNLHVVVDSGTLSTITNVVHVDDNNTSLTVDGYVTVSQQTGTNLHAVIDSGSVVSGTQIRNISNTWTDVGYYTGDAYMPVSIQGPVTVAQTTASNLNATVVQSAGSNLHTVVDGYVSVIGTKSNNSVVPGNTNIGVLPAVATSTAPTYIQGDQVALSTDLYGTLRVTMTDAYGNTTGGTIDNPFYVIQTSSTPNSFQDIAFGKILMPGSASFIRFDCFRTPYAEQSSNAQRSIASSSANDTAAGTGARQVKITYFPVNLSVRKTETITLNGTTGVNTANNDICFIEKIEVISVGSYGANVGTISLYTSTNKGGSVFGSIAYDTSGSNNQAGIQNRTYWAHHYVLTGKTCYIQTITGGTQGNQNAEMFLVAHDPTNANSPTNQISDSMTVGLNSAAASRTIPNTIKIFGPAHIVLCVIPAGNNTSFYASFDFWEA